MPQITFDLSDDELRTLDRKLEQFNGQLEPGASRLSRQVFARDAFARALAEEASQPTQPEPTTPPATRRTKKSGT